MYPSHPPTPDAVILKNIRLALAVFISGLVLSGVTAFPLLHELNLLVRWTGAEQLAAGHGTFVDSAAWIVRVRDALADTYAKYPFIAYGTDWLAFGHLIIALFFVGPLREPARNIFILKVGLWSCVLVLPLALICGPIHGVPFCWRLVDCSFGVLGFPLLWYCLRQTRRLTARGPTDGR